MKLLPDYIIKYMPYIEDALEELRLSIIDHMYELIQRLDIDELSSDDIRDKLELYDIKTENMSSEWLPNGRFYRLMASIQHHRTRLNTLRAIGKSGGQFEGLWTNDFRNKSAYQYKNIQILRHYALGSDLDGYFYVSGNTDRNANGTIRSSARTALLNDIIMNQALPAGYTYLYLPWPRPAYPSESGYFYQVNMLAYDRLVYAKDCDHQWISLSHLGDEYSNIYFCPENHSSNQYYDLSSNQYGSDKDNCDSPFDTTNSNDREYFDLDDYSVPASTNYDWKMGTNTPWKTPYWIDYHYMNDMRHSAQRNTWPVNESGTYWAYDKYDEEYQTDDPWEAVEYRLNEDCKELSQTKSVFPTKCYSHIRYAHTPSNRKSNAAGINYAYDEFQIIIKQMPYAVDRFIDAASDLCGIPTSVIKDKLSNVESGNEVALYSYIDETKAVATALKLAMWFAITDFFVTSYSGSLDEAIAELVDLFGIDKNLARHYLTDPAYETIPLPLSNSKYPVSHLHSMLNGSGIVTCSESFNDSDDYITTASIERSDNNYYSADEYYHTNDSVDDPNTISNVNYFGPYRHDVLLKRVAHSRNYLNHFKQYKPFWNEKTPFYDMLQKEISIAHQYETYEIYIDSCESITDLRDALLANTNLYPNTIESISNSVPCKLYGIYSTDRKNQIVDALSAAGCTTSVVFHNIRYIDDFVSIVLTDYEAVTSGKVTLIYALENIYGIGLSEAFRMATNVPTALIIPDNYTALSLLQAVEECCGITEITVNPHDENEVRMILQSPGTSQIDTIRELRNHFNGLGLSEAKSLCENAPSDLPVNTANSPYSVIINKLESIGATVTLLARPIEPNSLFSWMDLKQTENRPSIPFKASTSNDYSLEVKSILKNNDPTISEETFTSFDRPTRSHLDPIYIGYFMPDGNQVANVTDQGDNDTISPDYHNNQIYYFDDSSPIEYDPTLYYTLVSLGYKNNNEEQYSDNQQVDFNSQNYIKAYLYGNPATGELFLNKVSTYSYPHSAYNYLTYKTSKVHKMWFSSNHMNKLLNNSSDLYNQAGTSEIYNYTENTVSLEYRVIGIYDENGRQISYASGSVGCIIKNGRYSLSGSEFIDSDGNPVTAAYVLFTVKTAPGSMDEINSSSVEANMGIYHTGTMPAMIYGSVTEIATEDN